MKRLLAVAALIAAAVAFFIFERERGVMGSGNVAENFPASLLDSAEQWLSELDRAEYDEQGRLLRRLRGRRATEIADGGWIRIERPSIDEYKGDGQRWRLEADEGWLSEDDRSVRLRGNVRMFHTDERNDDTAVLRIRGDELEWPRQGEEVIWKGDVAVLEGGIELHTSWLRVWDGDDGHGFEARGEGSSFIDRRAEKPMIGRARRLIYNGVEHHLRLLGSAELIRGDDTLRGDELNYYPQAQR